MVSSRSFRTLMLRPVASLKPHRSQAADAYSSGGRSTWIIFGGPRGVMGDGWYYAEGEKPVGPLSSGALVAVLRTVPGAGEVKVWQTRFQKWYAAKDVPQIAACLLGAPPNAKRSRPQQVPKPSPDLALGMALAALIKTRPADRTDAKSAQKRKRMRGRISFVVVLAIALLVGQTTTCESLQHANAIYWPF
jgi:hypothetical protein